MGVGVEKPLGLWVASCRGVYLARCAEEAPGGLRGGGRGGAAGVRALAGGGFWGCQAGLLLGFGGSRPCRLLPRRARAGDQGLGVASGVCGLRGKLRASGFQIAWEACEVGGISGLGSWFSLVHGRCSSPTLCSMPQCPFARWSRVAWNSAGATCKYALCAVD